MRIRQVKPSYFTDERVAMYSDSLRIFYIGTWMLADDGGYFDWDVAEIALQLYGYRPRSLRERWVRERSARLVEEGRLVIHDCGHAYVPHLIQHQHLPGNKTLTVTRAHQLCSSPPIPAGPRVSPQRLKVEGQVEGQGRLKVNAHAQENGADLPLTVAQIQQQIDEPTTSPEARKVWQKALAQALMREAQP